jgi:transcriptional regulator with XRE-family HTH domain
MTSQQLTMSPAIAIEGESDINSRESSFWTRLMRRYREYRDQTQETIANKSGLHLSYLSTIENGAANLSIDKMKLICNAVNVDPIWLHQQVIVLQQVEALSAEERRQDRLVKTQLPAFRPLGAVEEQVPFYL